MRNNLWNHSRLHELVSLGSDAPNLNLRCELEQARRIRKFKHGVETRPPEIRIHQKDPPPRRRECRREVAGYRSFSLRRTGMVTTSKRESAEFSVESNIEVINERKDSLTGESGSSHVCRSLESPGRSLPVRLRRGGIRLAREGITPNSGVFR